MFLLQIVPILCFPIFIFYHEIHYNLNNYLIQVYKLKELYLMYFYLY